RYSYETDTSYLHVTLRGTIAFMADGEILDFEDPAQPVSLGSIPAHDASAIDGNLLVTGSADNDSVELSVFDVDLFGGTTARGQLTLDHEANVSSLGRILLRDATAYITVGDEWWIIDLSDR